MRYAVYYAPPAGSKLWTTACRLLGYDAATGQDLHLRPPDGTSPEIWRALTHDPRRYGFHATLKAPFELACDVDEKRLLGAVADLALSLAPVHLPTLQVADIGRFVAIVPSSPSSALSDLARRAVVDLDWMRAPLSPADRARRLKSPLSERQIELLDRHGYPYVLEEFRFHMTLTGPIADDRQRGEIAGALAAVLDNALADAPREIDALTVFRQPSRDTRFRVLATFPIPAGRG
jgi:putative phosphonate metabolism protein